jgi:hypothetical protein
MGVFVRVLDIMDPETGEIPGRMPFLSKKKANLYGEYVMTRQEGFLRLAKDKDLTGSDLRVLHVYLGKLDFENFIRISQQEVADYLDMKKSNVSVSTRKLINKKIILEGPRVGRSSTFRINPFYGWKGDPDKDFHDLYQEHNKQIKG